MLSPALKKCRRCNRKLWVSFCKLHLRLENSRLHLTMAVLASCFSESLSRICSDQTHLLAAYFQLLELNDRFEDKGGHLVTLVLTQNVPQANSHFEEEHQGEG